MPYHLGFQWDPDEAGFQWGTPGDQPGFGEVMGGYWPGGVGPGQRYELARQEVFPQAAQRPGLGYALNRALPFLYSNYLAGLSAADVAPGSDIDPAGFGSWMLRNQGGTPYTSEGGIGTTRWGGLGGMYGAVPGAAPGAVNPDFQWEQLMQAARAGGNLGAGREASGIPGRYFDLLEQQGAPQAFTQVATAARPGMAGSVVANMQARAMERKRAEWNVSTGGLGTDIDWLGYITGESGLAREPFRTTPTTVVADPPGGGDDDDTPLAWITAWQIQVLAQAEGADQIASVGRYLQQEKDRRDTMSFADWQAYVRENPWDETQTYLR
jgi:hypothetical protein